MRWNIIVNSPLVDGAVYAPSIKRIAPLAVAGIAALGSTLVNQGLSMVNSSQDVKRQKDLMDYEWQNYKSPEAQVKALAKAGLNPSVALGAGGPGYSATPSNNLTARAPVQLTGTDFINGLLAPSEIAKNAAETKKSGSQAEGQQIQNELDRKMMDSRIEEIANRNHWTKEQTAKTIQEVGLLSASFNETQQRIENLRSQKSLSDKQVQWYDRHMSAEIEHIKSSAEYQRAIAGMTESQKTLFDATMDDMKSLTGLSRQQLEKAVQLLDRYGDVKEIIGMLSDVVGSASNLIGAWKSLNPAPGVKSTYKREAVVGDTKYTRTDYDYGK